MIQPFNLHHNARDGTYKEIIDIIKRHNVAAISHTSHNVSSPGWSYLYPYATEFQWLHALARIAPSCACEKLQSQGVQPRGDEAEIAIAILGGKTFLACNVNVTNRPT